MLSCVPSLLKDQIISKGKNSNLMKDEHAYLTSLVQGKNDCGGWDVPRELQMVLAHICRDQDELDESAVWQNFKEGSKSAS